MSISRLPIPHGAAPPAATLPPTPPTVPGANAGFTEPEGGVDWRRVVSAVIRFKWLICGVTFLGTLAGFGAARFVKPQFGAQATIWIDATERERRAGDRDRGPIRQGQLLDAQAWVDLLKSYVVLDQVARDQRMYVSPKSRADARYLTTFQTTAQYRPGTYRLSL